MTDNPQIVTGPTAVEIGPGLFDLEVTVRHPAPALLAEFRGEPPRTASTINAKNVTAAVAARQLRAIADELDPPRPATRESWSEDFGRGTARGTTRPVGATEQTAKLPPVSKPGEGPHRWPERAAGDDRTVDCVHGCGASMGAASSFPASDRRHDFGHGYGDVRGVGTCPKAPPADPT